MMPWWAWLLLTWIPLALGVAVVLGRSIRMAEEEQWREW